MENFEYKEKFSPFPDGVAAMCGWDVVPLTPAAVIAL